MYDRESFPEMFIHGIVSEANIEDNVPTVEYLSRFKDNPDRENFDFKELSINWYDCDRALEKILNQRNSDGEYQFQYGAILLLTTELEKLAKKPQVRNYLRYERYPLPDNEFHGNLLLLKSAQKHHKFMVVSGLILDCFKELKMR